MAGRKFGLHTCCLPPVLSPTSRLGCGAVPSLHLEQGFVTAVASNSCICSGRTSQRAGFPSSGVPGLLLAVEPSPAAV